MERSNYNVWRETFTDGDGMWWREVSGGHGTFGIVVKIADMPEDAIEFIEGLDGYCIADEDAHSRLEMEAQDESWESWARRDFARAVAKRFNVDVDLTDAGDTILFDVWREAMEEANVYWENQSGGDMYVDIDCIVAEVTSEQFDRIVAALPAPVQLSLRGVSTEG